MSPQQEELIEREIKGGARWVIVAPVRELNDPERLLESLAYSCPYHSFGNHPSKELPVTSCGIRDW